MHIDGQWVGVGVGDTDPDVPRDNPDWHRVTLINHELTRKYQWARDKGAAEGDTYTETTGRLIAEFQQRAFIPPVLDPDGFGIADYTTRVRLGSYPPPPPPIPVRPVVFTVEGHASPWDVGPCADTARILEAEGHCWWQGIGYNNGAIPFDNKSGVRELARIFGQGHTDSGKPFPLGTPIVIVAYSQGAIVATDFYADYLQPGQAHAARGEDLIGVLAYGNPCRATGSVAPWSIAQAGDPRSHGLDPYRRLGQAGMPARPDFWMDVWRAGDLFAENGDDKGSEVKAAVYQAVARTDFFSNPYSIIAQIAELFAAPFDEVAGIFMAIVSGVTFLANQDAHYAPFNIDGGVNWLRGVLANSTVPAAA